MSIGLPLPRSPASLPPFSSHRLADLWQPCISCHCYFFFVTSQRRPSLLELEGTWPIIRSIAHFIEGESRSEWLPSLMTEPGTRIWMIQVFSRAPKKLSCVLSPLHSFPHTAMSSSRKSSSCPDGSQAIMGLAEGHPVLDLQGLHLQNEESD